MSLTESRLKYFIATMLSILILSFLFPIGVVCSLIPLSLAAKYMSDPYFGKQSNLIDLAICLVSILIIFLAQKL